MKIISGDYPEQSAARVAMMLFPVLMLPFLIFPELLSAVMPPAAPPENASSGVITGSFYSGTSVQKVEAPPASGDFEAVVRETEQGAKSTAAEESFSEERKPEGKSEKLPGAGTPTEILPGNLPKTPPKPHPRKSDFRPPRQESPEKRHSSRTEPAERKTVRENATGVQGAAPEKPVSGGNTENAVKGKSGSVQMPSRAASSEGSRLKGAALIRKEAERLRKYPSRALRNGIQGSGTLLVRVNARGAVYAATVTQATGNRFLDQALQELAAKITGFDTGIPGESYEVEVPVRYIIR